MKKGVRLQSQAKSEDNVPMHPSRFSLRWSIEYSKGEPSFSEWTPSTKPSITKAFEGRKDGKFIVIYGHDKWSNYTIEFARIDFEIVDGFGYIGEQSSLRDLLNKEVELIIGMWVKLKDNSRINIYVNGLVKEIIR